MGGSRTPRLLWCLAGVLLALLAVKAFVADVYGVNSSSMNPTLFGDARGGEGLREDVLVLYDRHPRPERFDLCVLRARDGGDPLVKRVVGLPGEAIQISGGDLLIDGQRLPHDAPRPAPIAVFDARHQEVVEYFNFRRAPEGPWSADGDAWLPDALDVPASSGLGLMHFHKSLRDSYLDPHGERVPGMRQVNDAVLEVEVRCEGDVRAGGGVRLLLVEEGDTFSVLLEPTGEGTARLRLTRHNPETLAASDPEAKTRLLTELVVAFHRDRWTRLAFANVDNTLSLTVDGHEVTSTRYEANVPHPSRTKGALKSIGPRASFGGAGLRARFRRMRVLRDLYYTDAGERGTHEPVSLGPDEYFLLGDNSASSTDSRTFGPVPAMDLVGHPVAVVWPPSRARWLRPTERPAARP